RARLLELRLVRDPLEVARLARQLLVEVRQRLLALRVDEERGHVVRELVAGRALDGPVRAQLLAGLEDLLDPDVRDARLVQSLHVLARVREPVRVVDPDALDEPLADELKHLLVRLREDLRILLADAAEVADVEEAAVPAGLRIDVEELQAQLRVAPVA